MPRIIIKDANGKVLQERLVFTLESEKIEKIRQADVLIALLKAVNTGLNALIEKEKDITDIVGLGMIQLGVKKAISALDCYVSGMNK